MAFEQRDNSGSLFVNSRKTKENHPDRQGQAMIDGQMYWVSGWVKKTKDGENWLSMSFQKKEEQGRSAPSTQGTSGGGGRGFSDDLDSDVPF